MSSKHATFGFAPPQAKSISREKCQRFHVEHPFTLMVAGTTGSGKSVWAKSFVAAGSKGNPPSSREDCLVLFSVATGLH